MSREYSASCGRCNSCNTCQGGCNTCQKCVSCQEPCDNAQLKIDGKTCKTFKQFGTFNFSKCYSSGEIIGPGYFDGTVWQEIINHYNTIGSKGSTTRALLGGASLANPPRKTANNDYDALIPFSAQEFQRVASAVGYDNSAIKSDALIKGSYFKELVTAINNLRGFSDSCDWCNTNCNCPGGDSSKCIACQTCDTCKGCVSCQAPGNANCRDTCCNCNACNIKCNSGQSTPQPNTQ